MKCAKKIHLLTDTLKLKKTKIKQVWIRKSDLRSYMVNVVHKSIIRNSRYFDSGCSKHMTEDRAILTYNKSYAGGMITLGDDAQSRIEGITYMKKCTLRC